MNMAPNDVVPASLARRFAAFAIDVSILSMFLNVIVVVVALIFVGFYGIPNTEELAWKMQELSIRQVIFVFLLGLFLILIFAALWHLYFIYFEHIFQKTPGKKAMSLTVVSLNGKNLTFKQATLREVLRCYVDMLFIVPGFLSMLLTQKKQRLGDLATDTMVVYSARQAQESKYLYLSRNQYEFRTEKYKVLDASLEETNRFLLDARLLLMGQSVAPSLGEEFVNKVLVVQDPTFEDAYETKFRFVAEYFLQGRSPV